MTTRCIHSKEKLFEVEADWSFLDSLFIEQMNGITYNAKPIGNQTTGSSSGSSGSGGSSSALSTFSTSSPSVLLASLTLLGAACLL